MKRTFAAVVTLFAAACSDPAAPTGAGVPGAPRVAKVGVASGDAIPGHYIVVFVDGVDDVDAKTKDKVAKGGGSLKYTYKAAVKGFAAQLSEGAVAALRADPDVDYVEADQMMRASVTQTLDAAGDPWGLDRINQRNLPLDKSYTYTYTGSGVRAYIIDTGLDAAHAEFEGRAQNVYDAFGGNGNDCNGHGTHVGGTVGGKTYGVAKASLPRGVKVLDCAGSGSTSGIISALDWVQKNRINPAVANMSLGGGFSAALNSAVTSLSNSGVFVAVAAGNENQDACNVSPASAAAAFTTAASTRTDAKASYSNFGKCVDAYAPGSAIKSAWIGGGTTETNTISGTSMASPHVAGVSALVKHRYGDISSASVTTYIKNATTPNLITGNVSGTPNALLYKYITAW